MSSPLLDLQDVHVQYGPVQALRGISCHVDTGEVVSILGANGAGKSSILRAVSGLIPISSGRIAFNDEGIAEGARGERGLPPHTIVTRGITHCPEGRRIFPDLTVMENLEMGAYAVRSNARVAESLERVFHHFPRLKDRTRQLGATLSGGEQQMLGVARALMSSPRLLLLDEPSLGLAPVFVEEIFHIIHRINEEGVSILLVEQNAHEALRHSHRAYVLETGATILSGASSDLLRDDRVVQAYLGV